MNPLMTVKKPDPSEIATAANWDVWTKEISEFPWFYDEKETCFILEGKAVVTASDGSQISFGPGDWVIFEKGLKCTWRILQPIKKHYIFW